MEEIKGVILTVCMTAAALGLFRLILPDFRYSKQISFLLSCVFAVIVINSVRGVSPDINEMLSALDTDVSVTASTDSYRERLCMAVLDISEKTAAREIAGYLTDNGYTPKNTAVTAHIDDNLCISISDIRLVFDADCDSGDLYTVNRLLQQKFGRAISITAEILPKDRGGGEN